MSDAKRSSSSERGYDSKWRSIRDKYLCAHPICMMCGAKATIPHHIIAKRDGGTNDESNLLAVCENCHRKIDANAGKNWKKNKEKENNSVRDKGLKISTISRARNRSGN
jgi:5-methylcytosine-specific restriction protein A